MKHLLMSALLVGCNIVAAQNPAPSALTPQRPKAYMVADAHLDTQWNWDVQTTIKSHLRNTLEQNFMLLRQYPDYIFNFEGGVKYAWMKEYYPTQYEELKQWVDKGRWHLTGSSWDACETIVCSTESWIRNILLGQTFYRQEFGREGTDVFLPDCFGFPYTLPTLAAHCGLIGFSSQKLVWRAKPFYEGNKRYPFSVGLWKGIDGSQVMMAHGFGYGQRYNDEDLSHSTQLLKEAGESPFGIVYRYYGTGDIGGSPTIASVRSVEKGIHGDGPVQVISATSDQLYKDFLPFEQHPELPVYDGELTMDLHGNACYTSQAAMKLYNRQNEHLGDAAERSAVMADWAGAYPYPIDLMTAAWRRVIWHQFHDDLTGTSIPRAYEFSWNDELLSLKQFADVLTTSVGGIARQLDTNVGGTPVVVYNNEAFPVKAVVRMDVTGDRQHSIADAQGRPAVSQRCGDQLLFEAQVPASGFAVYSLKTGGKAPVAKAPVTAQVIENSIYRISVDSHGDIESLIDKREQRELVADGRRIRLVVFDDCESKTWPAWEIQKATIDKAPLPVHDNVTVQMTEDGPLRKTLCISKQYGTSVIRQLLHLYEGSQADRIDFETTVDWQAENALLKAEFPLSISNERASYDIGLGRVERGNNRENQFEVYAHEWTDLTDRSGSYGVTILNDSRYGWDKPDDHTLRLSLLYAPKPGRGYVYQAHQDKGHHVLTYSIVGHQGGLDMVSATRQSTLLNSPLRAFVAPKHKGQLGRAFSFVNSSNDRVLVRALKRAETTDEYVIRVYELGGQSEQTADITFAAPIVQAVEADGTERTLHAADFDGRQLKVRISPFSVKTYKVTLQMGNGRRAATQSLPLSYNRKCATFNAFRSETSFENGYSYAAELFPDGELTVDGIRFNFGERDARNGLSCRGDTLLLPADNAYTHLYLLAASDQGDRTATFAVGKGSQSAEVPFYSGFVGQWGHEGQGPGFLKRAKVAWVGTHRHSPDQDEPYEFTYMFMLRLDIPKGATQVVLPQDEHIVLFAATLADDDEGVKAAARLFETSNVNDDIALTGMTAAPAGPSLLKDARVLSYSGYVNDSERPELMTDGDSNTKWCDSQDPPHHVAFDLGSVKPVSAWHLVSAGSEMAAYITRVCLLQGRINEQEEWQTLDMVDGNHSNEFTRSFTPTAVRYVRLYVVGPTQEEGTGASRIYEFELF